MNKIKDPFSLKNQKAVLTGAAGFFGVYFAESLLQAGVSKLYVSDKNEQGLKDLQKKMNKKYGEGKLVIEVLDQYNIESSQNYFEKIAKMKVDILINNAFDFTASTGFYDKEKGIVYNTTYEHLKKTFEAALYWPFQATQIFGNFAKKNKRKLSVINIGSMYSFVVPNPLLYEGTGYFNPPGYSMMKAGLLNQTRYMAAWYAPYVRVNALCPGAIPNYHKSQNKDKVFTNRLTERTLLKRLGHPNDLTGTLVFLASGASDYVTGQTVVIDGGWIIT